MMSSCMFRVFVTCIFRLRNRTSREVLRRRQRRKRRKSIWRKSAVSMRKKLKMGNMIRKGESVIIWRGGVRFK